MLDPDLLEAYRTLSDDEKVAFHQKVKDKSEAIWSPNFGPQTEASMSLADLLLYGGQGGGGKSDLGLGLAFTQHRRSLILRRKYTDLGGLIDRAIEINGSRKGFNGAPPPKLRTDDNRLIQFGANQFLGDEQNWQGQPYDLKVFDEAVQFLLFQIQFHLGWIRSADPSQRSRALLTSNPPIDASGDWIIGFFRPWLDLTHSNPAKHGELRWYITDEDGEGQEVEGPEPIERDGRTYRPQSRTFIPARLSDNPYLIRTNYQSTLDSLPEPLRSAVRDGNFMASRPDADFQVIPTEWILAAQERWTKDGWRAAPMTAMAIDPAGGGKDGEELISRHGGWFSEVITHKGKVTAGGDGALTQVYIRRRDGAPVVVDVGGGYANVILKSFEDNHVDFFRFDASHAGHGKARDMRLPFYNRRAQAWWRLREALDPSQDGGSIIALPPDPEIRADLAAPTYLSRIMQDQGLIQIEPKDKLRARLGRSPGKGEVVVMCLFGGEAVVERAARNSGSFGRRGLPQYAKMKTSGPLARYRKHRAK